MTEETRPFISSTVRVLTLMVAILILLFAATNYFITTSENNEFRQRYEEIEPGMSESAVVSLLGTPHERSSTYSTGRGDDNGDILVRPGESGATLYLSWHKGTDDVYIVGFNAEGRVVVVETSNE